MVDVFLNTVHQSNQFGPKYRVVVYSSNNYIFCLTHSKSENFPSAAVLIRIQLSCVKKNPKKSK